MADIDAPLAWRMQQDGYLMQINQLRDEKTALCTRIDELCAENEKLREFLSKMGPSNEMRECVNRIMHDEQRDFKITDASELTEENTKLRKLVNGLTWCCEHSGCDNRCPLYDRSEPDHCCEERLKRELKMI